MNPLIVIVPVVLYFLFFKKGFSFGYEKPTGYKQVLQWRRIAKKWVDVYAEDIPYHIVLAIIAQESMGNPDLGGEGSAGEVGIMQITPMGLAYSESGYTMSQIESNQDKNIETGVRHLAKDYQYFSDLNYAIMAYNIDREHIKAKLRGTATANDEKYLTTGRTYLNKIIKVHAKKILPMLAGDLDNPESPDYVAAVE